MNNYYILTLFPEMIENGLKHSIIKRAIENKIITLNTINIRNFANNKHKHIDDSPYGGGAGMVMQAPPIYDAYMSIKDKVKKNTKVIYMTPQGKLFNQSIAKELSEEEDLIILCGHYEGVDERIIEEIVTEEISIGDYVLTGGELAAMIVIDAAARLVPGVLNKNESFVEESFNNNLLEYPQYTRPFEFKGRKVPDILLSGHHQKIKKWRKEQSIIRTLKKRPELLNNASLTKDELLFIQEVNNSPLKW